MPKRARGLQLIFALLALAGLLGAALAWRWPKTIVDSDQLDRGTGSSVMLAAGQPVGQTFVARHAGLAGIEFLLVPTDTLPVTLTLHLRADPQSTEDLRSATVRLPSQASAGFYRFEFDPVETSHSSYYYAFLEATTAGVSVPLANGGAYLDGAAYQTHQPLDAQAAFRLVYAPGNVVLDLFGAIGGWIGLLLAAGLLFVVPGWALLAWLVPHKRLSWAEMMGLAVGIGLALYPLLFLWTDLVGWHLGPLYAWLPPALGLAALAWRYRTWRPRHGWEAIRQWASSNALWPDLALLAVLALAFGVRLLVVRSLDAPMWGDSYQHTLITQLLIDNNGLFHSWEPYVPIDRFTYHFGFHSAIAVLHWLTGMGSIAATLWGGQLINGLAVLALYPLAVRVTGSRWGGLWAVLLAGLLSPMPMFYVNWGRYTQLAGQVVLPAAVWLTWEAVETPQRPWRLLALAAVVAGGLALTHYRIFILYGAFVLALMLLLLRPRTWRESLMRLACTGAGTGLLFLPWFVNAFGANLWNIFWTQATTLPAQAHPFTWEYNAVGPLDTYLAPIWWLALALGIGSGLWRRERNVLLTALWWLLLLIATNPAWLSLPGTGVITNFALFIAIYLPAGLLSGVLVSHLLQAATFKRRAVLLLIPLVAALAFGGTRDRLKDLSPNQYALVTRPDIRAAAWIETHTPPEARFLINCFPAYGGTSIVGADGGWWLPLLAGRQTTLPPLTYVNELPLDSSQRQQIYDLAQQVESHDLDDPTVVDVLRQEGVTYVYVGQRQGKVGYTGEDIIQPDKLAASDSYRVIYHQDLVWIFEIEP